MIIQSKKIKIFDSDALKNFHKRIFFSIIVFLFCYFTAILRIADVMIIDFTKKDSKILIKENERGKIYDRNGQLLSTTIKSYSLFVNAHEIKNLFI